ncbi:MAG TPA: hypothetical protein VFX51_13150 [Solirubrobacteraceae bacterium]|nr:hypothetical protein [Solirubrobacteraceae bacterium]
MPRTFLLAAFLTLALPAAAHASVIPTVAADTLTISGDGAADSITVRAVSPTTLDVDGTTFDRSTFSKIAIRSGAGNDTIRIADALTEAVTIESGTGGDTVVGGPGNETIAAGDDADFVHPGGGDDKVTLGAGNDTAIQGDGFDQIDGQAGIDELQAAGSDESEEFTLQANGTQARIARDTGPATTDSAAIETLDVAAAGGQDLVDIGDLAPTAVKNVNADLGAFDSDRDQIAVQGTDLSDLIQIRPFNDDVRVDRPGRTVQIHGARAADDRLTVFGRAGSDSILANANAGANVALTLDGGAGPDVIDGSAAADTLVGGADTDVVTGRQGDDIVDLGDGNDRFTRSPQDGFDRVEGGAGTDTISAVGSTADDFIEVSGLVARTRVRDGLTEANLGTVETVEVNPLAGTDNVTVQDLTGTATRTVNVGLSTADLRVDTLTAIGSQAADSIKATTSGTTDAISGLAATVNVVSPERGEKVVIDGRGGDDTVDASKIVRDRIQPVLKGGADKDVIIGTPGDDQVSGGPGVDVALLAGGLDTFNWAQGDGNDVVEGGAGTDFLLMNGTVADDRFDVSPIGVRTRVTRDTDNVNLDLGDLERLDILPGRGADTVHVRDLSGTDTDHVDVNLMSERGTITSDQAPDKVLIDGTFGNDVINVNGAGPDVRTTGLAAITTTRFSDPTLDTLHVDTKPGIDSFTVTGTANQLIGVTSS